MARCTTIVALKTVVEIVEGGQGVNLGAQDVHRVIRDLIFTKKKREDTWRVAYG